MSNDPDVQNLLHVCCFNVRGLITYLKDLLRNIDIIAISKHWLHDYNLNSFIVTLNSWLQLLLVRRTQCSVFLG